jgi:nucleoside phosphorylase
VPDRHFDAPDGTDVGIVCALEVERRAVCAALRLDDGDRELVGKRRYWRGPVRVGTGPVLRAVVTQFPAAANVHAAVRVGHLLEHWRCRSLPLVGVAAAVGDNQALGDVVVAEQVFYYELGKVVAAGTLPQPDVVAADPELLDAAQTARPWPGTVRLRRPDGSAGPPRRWFGVVASGEKVVGDPAFRDEVTAPHRKIKALEMEGYGVGVAALQSADRARHLVVRGLCDRADGDKNDEWHGYAAAAAASYVRHLLGDWPFDPLEPPLPWPPVGRARNAVAGEGRGSGRGTGAGQDDDEAVVRMLYPGTLTSVEADPRPAPAQPDGRPGAEDELLALVLRVAEETDTALSAVRVGRDADTATVVARALLSRIQALLQDLLHEPQDWDDASRDGFRLVDLLESALADTQALSVQLAAAGPSRHPAATQVSATAARLVDTARSVADVAWRSDG